MRVLDALRAFEAEYLAATGPANSRGYSPAGVVERAAVCSLWLDSLPKTRSFAPLRALVRRLSYYESMADYEDDVREIRGRRWMESEAAREARESGAQSGG